MKNVHCWTCQDPFELRNSNIKLIEGEKESHQRPAQGYLCFLASLRLSYSGESLESEKTCQQGQKSREDTEAASKLSPVTFLPEHRLQKKHVCPYLRLLETFSVLMIILYLFFFPTFCEPPSCAYHLEIQEGTIPGPPFSSVRTPSISQPHCVKRTFAREGHTPPSA